MPPVLSLSINPLYVVSGSFTQGELEGAKPASNWIKCRAKPCLARRAWSKATIFVPQGGTKITTLFQAVERAKGSFGSLKRNGVRRFFFFRNASPSVSVYMGGKIKQLVYKYPLLLSGGLYYNSKLPG